MCHDLADGEVKWQSHEFEFSAAEDGVAEIEPLQSIHTCIQFADVKPILCDSKLPNHRVTGWHDGSRGGEIRARNRRAHDLVSRCVFTRQQIKRIIVNRVAGNQVFWICHFTPRQRLRINRGRTRYGCNEKTDFVQVAVANGPQQKPSIRRHLHTGNIDIGKVYLCRAANPATEKCLITFQIPTEYVSVNAAEKITIFFIIRLQSRQAIVEKTPAIIRPGAFLCKADAINHHAKIARRTDLDDAQRGFFRSARSNADQHMFAIGCGVKVIECKALAGNI